jgi:hypothetical protein
MPCAEMSAAARGEGGGSRPVFQSHERILSDVRQTSGCNPSGAHAFPQKLSICAPVALYDGLGAELAFMQRVAHMYAAHLSYTGLHDAHLPFQGAYFNVDRAKQYVQRIRDAAANESMWLMLLEDDVWVCQTICAELLLYDMNGVCRPFEDVMAPFMRSRFGEERTRCYTRAGGTILNSSMLRTPHAMDGAFLDTLFNATAHQRNGYLASDEVLSAVVIHSGVPLVECMAMLIIWVTICSPCLCDIK